MSNLPIPGDPGPVPPPAPSPVKPGWQTSEAWITLITAVLAFLLNCGWLDAGTAKTVETAIPNAIALIAAGAAVWKYIASRTELKRNGG